MAIIHYFSFSLSELFAWGNKNIRIPTKKNENEKLSWGSETSDITSEGLGEMFEGGNPLA